MTPVTAAYCRWIAAEQDVHDAQQLLLWAIHAWEPVLEAQQKKVVSTLRAEASLALGEYLRVMCSSMEHLN